MKTERDRQQNRLPSLLQHRRNLNDGVYHEIAAVFLQSLDEPGPTFSRRAFRDMLKGHGLQEDDERISDAMSFLRGSDSDLTESDVPHLTTKCGLIWRATTGRLAIPDFVRFTDIIRQLYEETLPINGGKNADSIPQLAKVPDRFGVAVCTVDGQRYAIGDVTDPFTIQGCSFAITYAIAQSLSGAAKVHQHVGVEPSGQAYDEMVLDERTKMADRRKKHELKRHGKVHEAEAVKVRPAIPHNPCINAGAIMCASLVCPEASQDNRFEYAMDVWRELCGYNPASSTLTSPSLAGSAFLSEQAASDRNFCLAYMMREERSFPEGTDVLRTLQLYSMYCSIEMTVHTLSVVAGSFANGGTCPLTGRRIFDHQVVRNCLSVMQSCGAYDLSGRFAFKMGFPCKSGASGAMMVVIPGVCGFCVYSPRLGETGNSVRGVHFCELLSERFRVHMFAPRIKCDREGKVEDEKATGGKMPLVRSCSGVQDRLTDENALELFWAAYDNDRGEVRELISRGVNVNSLDWNQRTPLHIAASEGHTELVRYLLNLGANPGAIDHFGNTAISEAKKCGNSALVSMLEDAEAAEEPEPSLPDGEETFTHNAHRALSALTGTAEGFTVDDLRIPLKRAGIHQDDERIQTVVKELPPSPVPLTPDHLDAVLSHNLIRRTLEGDLVIPGWTAFTEVCSRCFDSARQDKSGHNADYIPVLAAADPEKFGVSICSVDGQRWSKGDTTHPFGVQSSMKPINYAIALETTSHEKVRQHIGVEPSGRPFNEMVLDHRRVDSEDFATECQQFESTPSTVEPTPVPHNPLINAGAIMCCSLIEEGKTVTQKLDTVLRYWKRLTGGQECRIDGEMYKSESETANRNRCLAYMMNEAGAFPAGADLEHELEFYFMCCSQLQTAESMSVVAGTLANGGVCPVTNERIFSELTVQSVLSVMFTCGMYDASGDQAFSMGFPSKSGVAGSCLIVVPNIMGICTWSPRLDMNGNSVRGVAFSKSLAEIYQIHIFDKATETLRDRTGGDEKEGNRDMEKQDLRFRPHAEVRDLLDQLMMAATTGDIGTVSSIIRRYGVTLLNMCDYDRQTPLHVACTDKQRDVVEFMVQQAGVDLVPMDRFGFTPLDEARKSNSPDIVKLLEDEIQSKGH